jgi:predicted amidohydrolase YtcJ
LPAVSNSSDLRTALKNRSRLLPSGAWLRGTGYHESVAGSLDRSSLDDMISDRPVRIQHRSGALWILNTMGIREIGLEAAAPSGAERDDIGGLTGRLFRSDEWLRSRLSSEPVDFAPVGHLLAQLGVTGVSDATPELDGAATAALESAVASGEIPQQVQVMGADPGAVRLLTLGPVKLVLDEGAGLDLHQIKTRIANAHRLRRPVAIHCVTRTENVIAAVALLEGGVVPGDRLEHASLLPPEFDQALAAAGVTIVTQPNFLAERGAEYLTDVPADELKILYRAKSLLDAGVGLAAGTDAPFGRLDPWAAMQAAVSRATRDGAVLTRGERISSSQALNLFTGSLAAPAVSRSYPDIKARADLCLLDRPLQELLESPDRAAVRMTIIGGEIVYDRDSRLHE